MHQIAYFRVSTGDQSIEAQRSALGGPFDQEFSDVAVSGITAAASREGFAELLTKVRTGDVVHVYAVDRLGRDAIDVQATVRRLIECGVTVNVHGLGPIGRGVGELILCHPRVATGCNEGGNRAAIRQLYKAREGGMSKGETEHIGLLRRVGRIFAWIIGGILILAGLLGIADRTSGSLILSFGSLATGALILPPVTSFMRAHWPVTRPYWVPPVTAFAVFFMATLISAIAGPSANPGEPGPSSRSVSTSERRANDIAQVESLIAEGTDESASSALTILRRYRSETGEGGALRPLFDQATAIREQARERQAVERYIARINDDVLPRVEAVFTGRAEAIVTISANLKTFDDAAKALRDGERFADNPAAKAAMNRLRATLVQKQRQAFPAMRASYGQIMDRELWEADTDVIVQGGGNRTVRFVSGIFAANRNIAAFHRNAQETLYRLRFRRAQYEWYRGSDFSYYTLQVPEDGQVGYWTGTHFTPVPAQ